MRRALVIVAAVTTAGCQCFDSAYQDYLAFCADSGQCDLDAGVGGGAAGGTAGGAAGGTAGGGTGGASGHVLTIETHDTAAGDCAMGTVWHSTDGGAPVISDVRVDVALSHPNVDTFLFSGCDGGTGSFYVQQGASSVDFWYLARAFGRITLQADAGTAAHLQPVPSFLSTARLAVSGGPDFHVAGSGSACLATDFFQLVGLSTSNQVLPASSSVRVTIDSPGSAVFGVSAGGCLLRPFDVDFAANASSVMVFAQIGVGMGLFDTFSANPKQADAGLSGVSTGRLYSGCFPNGHSCDAGSDCCMFCDSGTCMN